MAPQRPNLVSAILPKTLAGLAAYLVVFATGMAVSGVALFAFYQGRVSSLENRLLNFNEEFQTQFDENLAAFEDLVDESRAEIEKASKGVASRSAEMTELLEKVSPSIARVEGLDPTGQPAVGSAFVVTGQSGQTWLVTSFHTVAGAIAREQPVRVVLGGNAREGTVWSWDEGRDLALIILRVADIPRLTWATGTPELGSRVWGVGASLGKFDSAAAEGFLLDTSNVGLLSDVDVPPHASGGPLLTSDGSVLGVLSLHYAPPGFSPSNGWAVPIRMTCQRVLRCPG